MHGIFLRLSILWLLVAGAAHASPANPFAGEKFYVDPNSKAARTYQAWLNSRPEDARQIQKIASRSWARWLVGAFPDVYAETLRTTETITRAGALPVFVIYHLPRLDCGRKGAKSPDEYRGFVRSVADAIGSSKAVVILEPDALAQLTCLSQDEQETRYGLMLDAVRALKAKGNIHVYIDAGHSGWQSPGTMRERLGKAGIDEADGFSLNISNFESNATEIPYGESISSLVGGKHFVIDTSRNGLGPTSDHQWCNAPGRGLGQPPTAETGRETVDAFLWLKPPGESDEACNGGPPAGDWWPACEDGLSCALELARRAPYP
jgi:endoglucanase